MNCIDVSEHQGAVDWATLPKSAPDGFVIRAGHGRNSMAQYGIGGE